jgi:hypothetical protein
VARRQFAGVEAAGKVERGQHHACSAGAATPAVARNVALIFMYPSARRSGPKGQPDSRSTSWLRSRQRAWLKNSSTRNLL